jgi:hypothetical protein
MFPPRPGAESCVKIRELLALEAVRLDLVRVNDVALRGDEQIGYTWRNRVDDIRTATARVPGDVPRVAEEHTVHACVAKQR